MYGLEERRGGEEKGERWGGNVICVFVGSWLVCEGGSLGRERERGR